MNNSSSQKRRYHEIEYRYQIPPMLPPLTMYLRRHKEAILQNTKSFFTTGQQVVARCSALEPGSRYRYSILSARSDSHKHEHDFGATVVGDVRALKLQLAERGAPQDNARHLVRGLRGPAF